VSLISPATGVPTDEDARVQAGHPPATLADDPLVVPLYHARWRHFIWAVILGGLGGVLVASFGGTGRIVGLVLVALAVSPTLEFVRTLAHEAGAIGVSAQAVKLPPRVCAGRHADVPLDCVKHAYFVRRELPFMTTGPLLVVETTHGSFAYPRDWFASESDQRRLVLSINRRIGRRAA
jgi:hypothetical protein